MRVDSKFNKRGVKLVEVHQDPAIVTGEQLSLGVRISFFAKDSDELLSVHLTPYEAHVLARRLAAVAAAD